MTNNRSRKATGNTNVPATTNPPPITPVPNTPKKTAKPKNGITPETPGVTKKYKLICKQTGVPGIPGHDHEPIRIKSTGSVIQIPSCTTVCPFCNAAPKGTSVASTIRKHIKNMHIRTNDAARNQKIHKSIIPGLLGVEEASGGVAANLNYTTEADSGEEDLEEIFGDEEE